MNKVELDSFKPGHYLAFELTEKSRANLLDILPTKFSKVIAHHVTIEFNLTSQSFEKYKKAFNANTKVVVFGYASSESIECAAVRIDNKSERSDKSFYHVTLSLEPPAKPVHSNNLKNEIEFIPLIDLEGTFKLLKK